MVDIGSQANALLASQIPQIINPDDDQPSTLYARFWFARNWDFYGNLRDKRFPQLAFLNDYNHGILLGKTCYKTHTGHDLIGTVLQQNDLTLFEKLDYVPTTKEFYKQIKDKQNVEHPANKHWREQANMKPPFKGSWYAYTPCENHTKTYLWKTRHFILCAND